MMETWPNDISWILPCLQHVEIEHWTLDHSQVGPPRRRRRFTGNTPALEGTVELDESAARVLVDFANRHKGARFYLDEAQSRVGYFAPSEQYTHSPFESKIQIIDGEPSRHTFWLRVAYEKLSE